MVITVSTESIKGERAGKSGYTSSVNKSQKPSKVGATDQVIKTGSFKVRPGVLASVKTKGIEEGTVFYAKKAYINFDREVKFFYIINKYHGAYNPQTDEFRSIDIEAFVRGKSRGGVVVSDINRLIKHPKRRVFGPPWREFFGFSIAVGLMSDIPGTGVAAVYGFEEPI